MAKILTYSDSRGVTYNASYWRLGKVEVDLARKYSNFTFYGYKDKEARNSNKEIISSKTFSVTNPTEFDTYYAQYVAGTINLLSLGYHLANTQTFVVGSVDVDGILTPVLRTFFDGAEDDWT